MYYNIKPINKRENLNKKTRKKFCINGKRIKKTNGYQYLYEELLTSTTHGLPYILNPNLNFVERVFWVISFAGAIVLMFILLAAQYTRFIESPTVMSIEMNYFDWNISYPAITLCPLHKVNTTLYNFLINETFYRTGLKTDSFFWSIVSGGMDNLNIIYLNIPDNITSLLPPKNYSILAAELFRRFPSNSLTTNTNWTISLDTAMTEVGMCHVINSNVAVFDNPLKWTEKNQKYFKNNIELTIYEGDFLAQITNYAMNYKVYIHHPDELVLSTSPSFTFDVEGFVTFGLSVWSTRISEELRPKSILFRKCRFVNEPLTKRYPIYSYNHCILECRIRLILKLCGCVPHFYKPLDGERICTINQLKCVLNFKKEIMSLTVPESISKKFFHTKLPKSPRDCGCLSNCETDIYNKDDEVFAFDKSMSRLEIRINSFPKIRVVRDVIFNYYDVMLRSGGVVNLFIGSSIMSIIELIVILIKLLIYAVMK